ISWWAHADCPDENNCNYDRLDTDLHMGVIDPDGNWVPGAWSASWDNNYELVDFTAPKTGEYKIAVYKERADKNSNYLGIAWARDATYLPGVQSDYDDSDWDSRIMVRNDDATSRDTTVDLFFDHGSSAGGATYQNLPSNKVWGYNPSHNDFLGSAIVDGGEDVSAVVRTLSSSQSLAYGGMPAQSDLGVNASTRLYFPGYLNDFYGFHSYADVTNVGSGPATVKIRYYNGAGQRVGSQDIVLDANESHRFPSSIANASIGGVRIVSHGDVQPLAAVMTYYHETDPRSGAHAALSVGAHEVYLPSVFRDFYGWECAVNVFNTTTDPIGEGTITFYHPDGQPVAGGMVDLDGLPGYGFLSVAVSGLPVPAGWIGSAVVTADKQVVASVYQEYGAGNDWQTHRGVKNGAPSLRLPWLQRNSSWNGSLTVMNVGCDDTTATAAFYDASGNQVGAPAHHPFTWRYESYLFYPEIPSSARSAQVTTSPACDVVAIANESTSNISDSAVSYSGLD
ncbi:MAG: hypothetical protein PVH17_05690, partial [Anaerolineae bacterium]